MSNPKLGSGRNRFIGQCAPVPIPIPYNPADYEGAAVVGTDGQFYYSDGNIWRVPSETIPIARPSPLTPTNSNEQTQLRLTEFFSPIGLTQTGIFFQVASAIDGFDTPLFERTVVSTSTNLYQTLYPEDGLTAGQTFYWRALYTGTEGQQSEYSLPFRQVYPDLIETPTPVTRDGAVTGAVQLSPFTSADVFNMNYVETEIRFWELTQDPAVDAPVATATSVQGASVALPEALVEGQGYYWDGRYAGRVGAVGPLTYSEYSEVRTILKGAASMILVYDPALALSRTINLPLGVYGGIVNVNVDWGDGTSNSYNTSGIKSHTYDAGVTGLVTVTISGQLEQYGGNTNIQGLVRVDNVGFNMGLNSLREMFRNCTTNTIYCTPNLPPQVTSIRGMFFNASPGFDVQDLIVSDVQDFSYCFYSASSFNQPLADWDTSSATDMSYMFAHDIAGGSYAFNQPIGNWNVSNVTTMREMFRRAQWNTGHAFNQDIGAWDVSNVTDMYKMFGYTSQAFNLARTPFNNGGADTLKNWDVSSCQNFERMFLGSSFNQPLTGWNLSSAPNAFYMFEDSSFNNDVTGWVLPTNLGYLFAACPFDHPSIVTWDVSAVTDMRSMFLECSINQPIGSWDVSNVTNMSNMFNQAGSFNQAIGGWNVSNVTTMAGMFRTAINFNRPLGTWNVSNVTNMSRMFEYNGRNNTMLFNQNISNWVVSSVIDMSYMFAQTDSTSATSSIAFNQPIGSWDVSNVTNMTGMFFLTSGGVHSFNQDLSGWNLNPTGVTLNDFMVNPRGTNTHAFSVENYSRLLAGWANNITANNGPFSVLAGFGVRTYNATDYFIGELYEDAVEGRAYLTNSNRLTVSGAGDANADGIYLFNGATQLYEKANGWYFVKTGGLWELRDNLDVVQATQQDVGDLAAPQLVLTWNGDLATATVLRTGAAWTITDGGLV